MDYKLRSFRHAQLILENDDAYKKKLEFFIKIN